ncbi:MAG: ECF-type sigma factor [Gemmatimonadota bacterium]|nr:ECF-type sigma factor [Gemmatimonadota bacterium]
MNEDAPLTGLIQAAMGGDREAGDEVMRLVYDELKRLAHGIRRGAGETLSTEALVHEAWLKLAPAQGVSIESRVHFRHLAARAMRQIVLDEARSRYAQKRGGDVRPVTLDEALDGEMPSDPVAVLTFDGALEELQTVDARAAQVVECRVFGGMEVGETAQALEVSTATVKRDFRFARAFLAERLS